MTQRTHLHVGPPKTGTSYLQAGLWARQSHLRHVGLLHPGSTNSDQFRACALATEHRVYAPRLREQGLDTWNEFLAEIAAHPGDALLSSEFYARSSPEQATRIVTQLRAASEQVHVVITARDLGRQVVASWQQHVKRGGSRTLTDFWNATQGDGRTARNFWRGQDLPSLARRWKDAGADEVTLVVVGAQGSGPDQLWHDFMGAVGHPDVTVPEVTHANRGLGAVEIEVLRRMHTALPAERDKVRSGHLSSKFFTQHLRDLELPRTHTSIPAELVETVQERGLQQVTELHTMAAAGEVTVVGDLNALTPRISPQEDEVTEAKVADAATRVLGALVAHEADQRNEADQLRARVAELEEQWERRGVRRLVRKAGRLRDRLSRHRDVSGR